MRLGEQGVGLLQPAHRLEDGSLQLRALGIVLFVRGGRQRLHGLQGVRGSPEEVEAFDASEGGAPVLRILLENRFEALQSQLVFAVLERDLAFFGERVDRVGIGGHIRWL